MPLGLFAIAPLSADEERLAQTLLAQMRQLGGEITQPAMTGDDAGVRPAINIDHVIAELEAKPFKHPDVLGVLGVFKALGPTDEITYDELAARAGNPAKQGLGQSVALLERTAQTLTNGVPLFNRYTRLIDGRRILLYRRNPALAA